MNNLDNDGLDPFKSTKLFGLNIYFKTLKKLYENKKLPNVILLEGEKGQGKFTLSFHLINYILSKNAEINYNIESLEINKKSNLYKSIMSNTQENFFYLENEKNKTSIEDVRNIKKKLSKTLLNNLPRFIIIDDVELLNLNAANALLKLIEEPPENNYFIMIDNKSENIIQTLRSRALIFKIFLNLEQKQKILKDLILFKENFKDIETSYIKFTTHGNVLKFFHILHKLKLNINLPLVDSASILLNDYKKNKNKINLDCINFLLNIFFQKSDKEDNFNNLKTINVRLKTTSLLNQYRKYNLSNSAILEFIKTYPDYVK